MNRIFCWWLNTNFKTRLASVVILLISIITSNTIFATLISIQSELIAADSRVCRDLSIVLAHHSISLIQENSDTQLKNFFEELYLSTSTINYIALFDADKNLLFSFPMNIVLPQAIFDATDNTRSITLATTDFFFNIPTISVFSDSRHKIFDSVLPLVQDDSISGFLQLGLTSNPAISYSLRIAQDFSIIVFVAIWLMFILGTTFNLFVIAEPMKKLLIGLQNIASGNFNQRINDLVKGEVGDLIISFNEMSRRLLSYEKENIMQLISEKAKLEALVSTIADGAILLDTELRLLFVNQIAVKVFQWSNKDLIGNVIFQYLPIHVNEALLPILNSMIRAICLDNSVLQTQKISIDLHNESLKTFRFLLSAVSSYRHRGFSGVVITIQDITRETQLNEAKNQFVSNVSHELRTPLCNIRSFLETLIDYSSRLTIQQKNKFLAIAYSETQRLNILVDDVLDLSRLESVHHYILSSVVLQDVVVYIVKASQIIALNKKIQIVIEAHGSIEKALAHKSSLCQVLSNLISNSLKFTHRGGKIIIRIYPIALSRRNCIYRQYSRYVRLEIVDEGVGIDKAYQKQIFDRFTRIENNIHTLKGTGLGLSIVKNIVQKHNSAIVVYSEAGIGTSLWFDLPVSG